MELFERNQGIAHAEAREWFLPGGEQDDLVQIALLGLWEAARTFEPGHGMVFASWASFVIRRRLITAVKTANALHARMLTDTLRVGPPLERGGSDELVDLVPSRELGPHERLEMKERLAELVEGWHALSELERQAMLRHLDGHDDRNQTKAEDNATQRARAKLRRRLAA